MPLSPSTSASRGALLDDADVGLRVHAARADAAHVVRQAHHPVPFGSLQLRLRHEAPTAGASRGLSLTFAKAAAGEFGELRARDADRKWLCGHDVHF
jgi:hypothetical protein